MLPTEICHKNGSVLGLIHFLRVYLYLPTRSVPSNVSRFDDIPPQTAKSRTARLPLLTWMSLIQIFKPYFSVRASFSVLSSLSYEENKRILYNPTMVPLLRF